MSCDITNVLKDACPNVRKDPVQIREWSILWTDWIEILYFCRHVGHRRVARSRKSRNSLDEDI